MKNSLPKSGFTLIELLIVIALLGALAVGMLAALDPLEQIKKGRDTATRNTVEEIYNSFIRYYAIKSKMPWETADGSLSLAVMPAIDPYAETMISYVVNAGELKTDFKSLAGTTRLSDITLYASDNNHFNVCFKPVSKSFQADPNTKWLSEGSDTAESCKSQEGTLDCYWCVK